MEQKAILGEFDLKGRKPNAFGGGIGSMFRVKAAKGLTPKEIEDWNKTKKLRREHSVNTYHSQRNMFWYKIWFY